MASHSDIPPAQPIYQHYCVLHLAHIIPNSFKPMSDLLKILLYWLISVLMYDGMTFKGLYHREVGWKNHSPRLWIDFNVWIEVGVIPGDNWLWKLGGSLTVAHHNMGTIHVHAITSTSWCIVLIKSINLSFIMRHKNGTLRMNISSHQTIASYSHLGAKDNYWTRYRFLLACICAYIHVILPIASVLFYFILSQFELFWKYHTIFFAYTLLLGECAIMEITCVEIRYIVML